RARRGEGPALLEMVTYRWRGHMEGEPMTYRTREEIKEWQKKDPVPRFEKVLLAKGLLTQEDVSRIQKEADEEVDKAQKFSDESPEPNPEGMLDKVYATSHS
ncbi:thiamine pyrophosphate-dependent enzyme, partial [Chloroflexota bacterium]